MAQRKYFGTDGIRGKVGEFPITPDFILKLGWAVGHVLAGKNEGRGRVLIGKDTRISGYMFESALQAGLSAAGVDVRLLGPMPTPAIAYLTRTLRADAGIVISASHNPYYDNGIKFFSHEGLKLDDELEAEIEAFLEKPISTVDSIKLGKARRVVDAAGRYIEFCKASIPGDVSLKGMKIVLDCAHGATYHVAPDVFKELGAKVTCIGHEPDGLNINRGCGSTSPEKLQQTVIEQDADLGIAFDGDGDRLIMVDHKGELVDGDELLYVIARYYKRKGICPGGVVGTQMSNLGLEHALERLGVGFVRAKVGDRYVLQQLQEKGWLVGGESSGHMICLDKTTTGDGIIAALQVLNALVDEGVSLAEVKKEISKYPQSMINVRMRRKCDPLANEEVRQAVAEAEKLLGSEGRVLLRPSGTEPVVRVMVEGVGEQRTRQVCEDLALVVETALDKD
ncbi:phosphoglucosamine mutase [Pelagibaculum spongiae]|uniref:Phosphoglucosamine mutase n=1 Tax=Pelagibaculum spongiae TaxID=2080658 RepID=A0A2V1GZZ8_9GAMM|nr:phosphoglucosamine mutase [Pelagibaculum spongiae]PVZ71783.1 phosphoglucosamine mutase [Pelagibaculum spongiae]